MSDYWKAKAEKHWQKTLDLCRELGGLDFDLKHEKERSSKLSDEVDRLNAKIRELKGIIE